MTAADNSTLCRFRRMTRRNNPQLLRVMLWLSKRIPRMGRSKVTVADLCAFAFGIIEAEPGELVVMFADDAGMCIRLVNADALSCIDVDGGFWVVKPDVVLAAVA